MCAMSGRITALRSLKLETQGDSVITQPVNVLMFATYRPMRMGVTMITTNVCPLSFVLLHRSRSTHSTDLLVGRKWAKEFEAVFLSGGKDLCEICVGDFTGFG